MSQILYHLIILLLILCANIASASEHPSNQENISDLLNSLTSEHSESDNNKEEDKAYDDYISLDNAEVIILNKITAKSERVTLTIGEEKFFGNISIKLDKCIRKKSEFNPIELMLIKVTDHRMDDDQRELFYGWMVPTRPSLSTLEHPVYEIIAKECQK